MVYLPVPLNRVALGRTLPVDMRTPDGRLLLRRGQVLQSEAHRDMLAAHHACMTETDAQAWYKALERCLGMLRQNGADLATLTREPMPGEILDTDYLEGLAVEGGWLDLQEILRGLLYQGAQAQTPLPRLEGIQQKALNLLAQNPDEALFMLFQALPDLGLGYCATHALLSGVVGALTADKLALQPEQRGLLLRAALVMNIGMARPQDSLARQLKAPSPEQRELISAHPPTSADILRSFGEPNVELLDMVHWHHAPLQCPERTDQRLPLNLLHLADTLVAKMAPRISRPALSALGATKSLLQQATPASQQQRVAMASVLGFYPPGTYVQLANGEAAVVLARGDRANTPHVAALVNAQGMPLIPYQYRDTRHTHFAVRAPLTAAQVNIRLSTERITHLRQQHGV